MRGVASGLPRPASQADALSAERRVSAPSHCVLTLGIALELQPLMSLYAHWPARREELWGHYPTSCFGYLLWTGGHGTSSYSTMALILRSPCVRQP